uniref:Uncharacterized protein n=1 Tax=Meloidogyne floridensis TaxID=298350 RepID=A0A915NIH2_9BILA
MVAFRIKPDGQSYLIPDNVILESDSQLNDFTILQIPGEINKQLEQKLIVAIVNFVFDGKIFGELYIAVFLKNFDGKGYCSQTLHGFTHYYDPATLKPFLNIYLDK